MNSPWHVSDTGRLGETHPRGAGIAEEARVRPAPQGATGRAVFEEAARQETAETERHTAAEDLPVSAVTGEGAAWLVSASTTPRTTLTRWTGYPEQPLTLPCGVTFDVVNTPVFFGRRVLDQLLDDGPGAGPVAVHRGRILLFAAPGTAQRLPSLLRWEEWGAAGAGRGGGIPALLCHGPGDAVNVPPLAPGTACTDARLPVARWLIAPAERCPWLPGPEVLLWACVRAVRAAADPASGPRGARAHGRAVIDFSSRRPGC